MEEDLTDDDGTKDPIFMPGRHDIDSDDFNPPENIMPTNDTDQSNNDVSELFKTPNLQSKEAKEVEGSRTIHSIQALADHIHSKRLDTRQSVYGDGHCFFSAVWLLIRWLMLLPCTWSCVNIRRANYTRFSVFHRRRL